MKFVAIMGAFSACVGCAPVQQSSQIAAAAGEGEVVARPIIIAHRGASGYRPEHTLAGYDLAIDMGADYIEPDLVITKDGVLVARHDNYLSTTTDVAAHPEFAARKRLAAKFGRNDWWVEDFTLAEIKTLRAIQPFPGRSKEYDGQFEIPTFAEIMALVQRRSRELGHRIGVYPETKKPGHFKALGLDFEVPLLEILAEYGYGEKGSPVFIQSFELDILKSLRPKTELNLLMLVMPPWLRLLAKPGAANIAMKDYAGFVDAVGPSKSILVGKNGQDTGFIAAAHALGLKVHPWTFRNDRTPDAFETPEAEIAFFLGLGVDGLFTDFTDTGVAARDAYLKGRERE